MAGPSQHAFALSPVISSNPLALFLEIAERCLGIEADEAVEYLSERRCSSLGPTLKGLLKSGR